MTVPTTLTTVLSTSSAPAAAATSRTAIGAVISYSWSIHLQNAFRSAGKCTRVQLTNLSGVFWTSAHAISIAKQGVTAPADGELAFTRAQTGHSALRSCVLRVRRVRRLATA